MADHRLQATPWKVRRLMARDASAYQRLRLEGLTRQPLQFRIAPEDERGLSLEAVGERLDRTFVAGGFDPDGLVGVGGLTRFEGTKLRHRALLWGMYVRERARSRGLADKLMRVLLAEARTHGIEQVILPGFARRTCAPDQRPEGTPQAEAEDPDSEGHPGASPGAHVLMARERTEENASPGAEGGSDQEPLRGSIQDVEPQLPALQLTWGCRQTSGDHNSGSGDNEGAGVAVEGLDLLGRRYAACAKRKQTKGDGPSHCESPDQGPSR
jgi:GNAT superfamily N-acetyltransferase